MWRGEQYRNEWKYLIDTAQKEAICSRLAPVMELDPHAKNGGYSLRSLYFEDYFKTAYSEKDAGVMLRKKYRIRIYDYSDKSIKLERKKKTGSYVYKESANLTRQQVYSILEGDYDFLLASDQPLCREFYYECVSNVMRPRTIVDYERQPWVLDAGTVRITFDMDVRAAVGSYDIFDPTLPGLAVLEPGKCVMEVKFTQFIPNFVREILPDRGSEFTAVSKYVMCYEKTAYQNGFDYWVDNEERK